MLRTRIGAGILVTVVLTAGCSKSHDGRMEVSGTVRLKRQPIQDGAIILFEPLDNQDTAGNATVAGGAFTIPRASGLKPGKYLIRVTAGDGQTAVNPLDANSPPGPGSTNIISQDLVPEDWNVNSKRQVTVTKDGPNKFDFDIP
jgi:hypothetical protein